MDKELKVLMQKISLINFVLGVFIGIVIQLTYKNTLYWFLGLALASINLYSNARISDYLLRKTSNISRLIYILSNFIRFGAIIIITVLVYRYNSDGLMMYILGYIFQLVGIIIYGLSFLAERK